MDVLPPPPPPPLSPPAPSPPSQTPELLPPETNDAARAGLLESIRQAGGVGRIKLRSVKQEFTPKAKISDAPTPKKAPAGRGDLMKDLNSMLALKKKGGRGPLPRK